MCHLVSILDGFVGRSNPISITTTVSLYTYVYPDIIFNRKKFNNRFFLNINCAHHEYPTHKEMAVINTYTTCVQTQIIFVELSHMLQAGKFSHVVYSNSTNLYTYTYIGKFVCVYVFCNSSIG